MYLDEIKKLFPGAKLRRRSTLKEGASPYSFIIQLVDLSMPVVRAWMLRAHTSKTLAVTINRVFSEGPPNLDHKYTATAIYNYHSVNQASLAYLSVSESVRLREVLVFLQELSEVGKFVCRRRQRIFVEVSNLSKFVELLATYPAKSLTVSSGTVPVSEEHLLQLKSGKKFTLTDVGFKHHIWFPGVKTKEQLQQLVTLIDTHRGHIRVTHGAESKLRFAARPDTTGYYSRHWNAIIKVDDPAIATMIALSTKGKIKIREVEFYE